MYKIVIPFLLILQQGMGQPVDKVVKAGQLAGVPVMIDFGGSKSRLPIEHLFMNELRPGDIFTHCFAQLSNREFIVDTSTQKIKPFVFL